MNHGAYLVTTFHQSLDEMNVVDSDKTSRTTLFERYADVNAVGSRTALSTACTA